MSMGTSTLAAVINQAWKTMALSGGPNWAGDAITFTFTGYTGSPANVVLMAYRGTTKIAQATLGVDSGTSFTVTIDMDTEEERNVFDAIDPDNIGEISFYLYDSLTAVLIASAKVNIISMRAYGDASPIPPVGSTTIFVGDMAFPSDGKTYLRSPTDGLYYQFAAYGSGSEVTEMLDTHGYTAEELT